MNRRGGGLNALVDRILDNVLYGILDEIPEGLGAKELFREALRSVVLHFRCLKVLGQVIRYNRQDNSKNRPGFRTG